MINPVYVLQSATPGTPPYPITSDDLRLGRAPDCGIVLSDDAVSWHHATLREVNGEVVITDENSTNGVFVDERKIQAGVPYPIRPGQTLRIGAVQFSLALVAPPPLVAPPIEQYEPTKTASNPWLWLIGGVIVVALAFVLLFMLMNQTPVPATPPPALTPTATHAPQPTSTLTPVPIVTATPTRLVSPALAASPTAKSVQSVVAEMEAVRTVLNRYGGYIDQAGSATENLNCAAIVDNSSQAQAALARVPSSTPPQALIESYSQSLSRFLTGAHDLTEACRSRLSGSNATITSQQLSSARTAVIEAVGVLDQIIPQIKSLP